MAIHINKDHPDYSPHAFECKPYLDGQPLRDCIWADPASGVAEVYSTQDGNEVLSPDGQSCKTELVRGKVELLYNGYHVETPDDIDWVRFEQSGPHGAC